MALLTQQLKALADACSETRVERAGRGLNLLGKAADVPIVRRISPVLWAKVVEKSYKVMRIAVPELP